MFLFFSEAFYGRRAPLFSEVLYGRSQHSFFFLRRATVGIFSFFFEPRPIGVKVALFGRKYL